jgi:hypothetical protein
VDYQLHRKILEALALPFPTDPNRKPRPWIDGKKEGFRSLPLLDYIKFLRA